MAISNAEAQRRWRQRQKEKRHEDRKQSESSHWYVQGDFQSYLHDHPDWSEFELPLDLMGLPTPTFQDGTPETASGMVIDPDDPNNAALFKAMGRADVFVGLLLEAATVLARRVNEFKLKEIGDRIQEIEAAEWKDPAAKKQALNDIVRLTKMQDQLSKQVRITLPQWKVTGE